ncbi:MAG TPA: BON domain-containing protein [Actinoplanes sp.]|nr:BON domain-containing protein [Actinoplanes sp.]
MLMWPWPEGDPFATGGRGFPAMDNPDVRLTYEVARRLQADPRMRATRIAVEVQNGVVILDGTAGVAEVKQLAADTARGTPGVRDVCNALRVSDDEDKDPLPELERPTPPSGGPRRWTWTAGAAALVTAWALLSVVIVILGWVGVVIGFLCAAVTLQAVLAVRDRRRTRHGGD